VRLGRGVSLVAAGAVPRLSLAAVLIGQRIEAGLPAHATVLAHQKALARSPANEEPAARQLRLRAAYNDAVAATPEDTLAKVLHGCAPSANVMWELQRRLAAQFGLQALLTHAFGMRTMTPETLVLRRDAGAAELIDFSPLPPAKTADAADNSVPFRLTRTLQQFITPLGIDGPFSGAFCAASECFANQSKVPLPIWIDALARPEGGPGGGDPSDTAAAALAEGLVPWSFSGQEAAKRVQQLSPVLLTKISPQKGVSADVHAKVRSLVDAATNPENLCTMPSAFQAWL